LFGDAAGRGAVEDVSPAASVAEQAAAPVSSGMRAAPRDALRDDVGRIASGIPGVVRGSSLAKSGVRPIPKGKGK
jgi:hypothetical protein